MVLIMW